MKINSMADFNEKFQQKAIFVLIFFYILGALWFQLVKDNDDLIRLTLLQAGVVICAGVWLGTMILSSKIRFRKSFILLPTLLYLLICVISLKNAINIWDGLRGFLKIVTYIMIFLIMINCVRKKRFAHTVIIYILLLSGVVSFLGILQYWDIDPLRRGIILYHSKRVESIMGNPTFLAAYLSLIIPIALNILLFNNYRTWEKNDGFNRKKMFLAYYIWIILSIITAGALFLFLITKGRELSTGKMRVIIHGILPFIIPIVLIIVPACMGYIYDKQNFLNYKGKAWRYIYCLIFISMIICLIMSGTRAAFIGLIVSGIVNIILLIKTNNILLFKDNKKLISTSMILFVFFILFFSFPNPLIRKNLLIVNRMKKLFSKDAYGVHYRAFLWKTGYLMFREYPFFGAGIGNFRFQFPFKQAAVRVKYSDFRRVLFRECRAHNEYLQFAAETGIIGVLAFISILALFIFKAVKGLFYHKGPQIEKVIMIGLICSCITIIFNSFMHFPFHVIHTSALFWTFAGMCFVLNRAETGEIKGEYWAIRLCLPVRISVFILLLAAALFFLTCIISTFFSVRNYKKGVFIYLNKELIPDKEVRWKGAGYYFMKADRINFLNSDVDLHFNFGACAYECRDYKRAEPHLTHAINLGCPRFESYYYLYEIKKRELEKYIEKMRAVNAPADHIKIKNLREEMIYLLERGLLICGALKIDHSSEWLSDKERYYMSFISKYRAQYGHQLHKTGRPVQEIVKQFQSALKVDPYEPIALQNMAMIYLNTMSADGSNEVYLKRAAKYAKRLAGIIMKKMSSTNINITDEEKIKYQRRLAETCMIRATALEKLGMKDRAVKLAKKAFELRPDDKVARDFYEGMRKRMKGD